MSTTSGRALLALGLSSTLLFGLGGCAAAEAPTGHSVLQFRPVLATVSQVGSDPLTADELEMLGDLDCETLDARSDPPASEPLTACDGDGQGYLLGPAELDNADIAGASASPPPSGTTQGWGVLLVLDADGTARFVDLTTRLFAYPVGDTRATASHSCSMAR